MEISKRQLQDEEVTAYHGGPHSFDKFSTQYMSTGEGGQAFGWGLYFTDLEDVAKYYAETIGNDNTKIWKKIEEIFYTELGLNNIDNFNYSMIEDIQSGKINIKQAINRLKNANIKLRNVSDEKMAEVFNKALNLERQKKYIYKVTLHKGKTPEQYNWLEWNKPLKENQKEKILPIISNSIRSKYKIVSDEYNNYFIEDKSGYRYSHGFTKKSYAENYIDNEINIRIENSEKAYQSLSDLLGGPKEASLFLLRAGIDGVKFPTGTLSTALNNTKGFNYVVFDENAVNIEKQTQLEGMEISKRQLQENLNNIIYTAVFFDTNEIVSKYPQVHPNLYSHHSTIQFKPTDISNLPIGEEVNIKVIGRLTNDKVDALIVSNPLSKNKFPHITLSTAQGIKPFQSNAEIENNQDDIEPINDNLIGTIGYFDGKNEVTEKQTQFEAMEISKKDLENQKVINQAHKDITRTKGKDYAPNKDEIQKWIDNNPQKVKQITKGELKEDAEDVNFMGEITKGELEEAKKARTKLRKKKKADRCLRIARSKMPQTSAYRSGNIVRCRQGKIWRGLKENWEDTSWANDGEEVTLKDLLNVIKNYPIVKAPIGKVKKIVIKKDSGGIESNRLNIADFKYPIIIIVDDSGNYQYILDGNHRANKAIDNDLKFIPAKLVNIKNLPQEFQNVLAEDETLDEKWSEKYKKSIDCNNPKGFSQKAHCKGRLKEEDEYGMSGVKQLQNKLLDKYKGLKTLFLYASKGVLSVDMIEVNPNERNKGVGSNVMNDIIEYADANNMEIRLNPAIKDERKGTTSRNRLVRFYKSFGFIENTGRNIDYTKKSGSMYRLPKSAEQLNEKTDFSKEKKQGLHGWFARQGGKGKSKGWVDCNTCRDGKCKSCGRKEGEKRSKYPACRPTPSACKTKGKGRSWGKKSKLNEDNQYLLPEEINEILKGYIEAALWTEEERLNDEYGSEHNKVFKDYDEYEDKEDTELDKLVKLSANINNKGIESFTKEDIEPNSLIKAYTDIKKFIQLAGDSVYEAIYENGLERLGTDIWFTRNGHGAGFFDHSYDYDDEKKLIQAGKSLGSVDLYINDNLKLSFSNQHLYEQSKQDIKKDIKLNEIKNLFKRHIGKI